jgi:hypothetical protein
VLYTDTEADLYADPNGDAVRAFLKKWERLIFWTLAVACGYGLLYLAVKIVADLLEAYGSMK